MLYQLLNNYPLLKLLLLILIVLVSQLFFNLLGLLILETFYGYEFSTLSNQDTFYKTEVFYWMVFLNQIGIFLVPSILFIWKIDFFDYRFLFQKKLKSYWLLLPIWVFGCILASGYIDSLVQQIPYFANQIEVYLQADKQFFNFIKQENFFFLTIAVGLLPAICEELFFRGVIQNTFLKIIKNYHLSIWITASIFSLFHNQILHFPARLFLGIMIGYSYYFSKNIIIPILFHFINNMVSLIGVYLFQEESELYFQNVWWVLFSLACTLFGWFYYQKFSLKETDK